MEKDKDSQLIIVHTTFPTEEEARQIARQVLDARLAACVQYYPIQSMYHWQGKIEQGTETGWIAKTRRELAGRLMEFIKNHHSYEVPEIIALPVLEVNQDYQQWLDLELT